MLLDPRLSRTVTIVATCLAAVVAQADQPRRFIAVDGEAFVTSPPDLAIIGFAVETTAPDAAGAMSENARKSQAVSQALNAAIANTDMISTSGFSLEPVYDHRRTREPDQPPAISGYIARNQVSVETADTAGVGKLIDLAAKAGANRISGLQFTLQARGEATAKALAAATVDAKHKAGVIAAALDAKLGPVLEASTVQPVAFAPRAFRGAAMAMEADMATPVDAGDVRVDANVHVKFAID